LRWDEATRRAYATDASHYQRLPLAVALPRTRQDCVALVQFAAAHGVPLVARAGGTSLAGQVVGPGLLVDTSRYLRGIIEVDVEQGFARVEPGVVVAELNEQLRPLGLHFAPDPSTATRATVAGVIGNNAWGAHAPRDGTTREHVQSVELLAGTGETLQLGALNSAQVREKAAQADREGGIYRTLQEQVGTHHREILARYPPPDLVPCNMGYALHVLARGQPWNERGAPLNLSALVCGSEGTLGLVTQAQVRLTPLPQFAAVICAHFTSLAQAVAAVAVARAQAAAAVELLDRAILDLTLRHLGYRRHGRWIVGNPAAVLLIEFTGSRAADVVARAEGLASTLRAGGSYAAPCLVPPASEAPWALRRAGLGLLMGMGGPAKPVTLVEDSAVPVAVLPEFVAAAGAVMARHGLDCVYYGSVGMGLIHLRPRIDLHTPQGRALLQPLTEEIAQLLLHFGGSLSAKHGDGRLRSGFLTTMLGADIAGAMRTVKQAFDPENIFNPGKLFDAPPMDTDLRAPLQVQRPHGKSYFSWRSDGDLLGAAERCHGAAVCRQRQGPGTMCPSFRALGEEVHSTRGRATVFRQLLSERGYQEGLSHDALHEVLELCLACKGCLGECPASVDMARLKAEHLQHYYDRHGVPPRVRALQHLEWAMRAGRRFAPLFNGLVATSMSKRLLGFHPQRRLPALASMTLSRWFARQTLPATAQGGSRVVLLNDPFTEYFDVELGQAAVQVLWRLGFEVILSPCFPSLRTAISQGLLRVAQQRLRRALPWLHGYAAQGLAIVGIEPAELLAYRDEALALVDADAPCQQAQVLAAHAQLLEEFLLEHGRALAAAADWQEPSVPLLVHVHCHQKALIGAQVTERLLGGLPGVQVQMLPSGCCGMAGAFGYQREHFELSRQVGELVLLPAVRQASAQTVIVANGTSCRQQIRDFTGRAALHPVQVLQRRMSGLQL
jgi:FAD/FMN-containing dehydrogenase/Fe-S oxidoreductase